MKSIGNIIKKKIKPTQVYFFKDNFIRLGLGQLT